MRESCHTCGPHRDSGRELLRHVCDTASILAYEWVMSRIWMRHLTHVYHAEIYGGSCYGKFVTPQVCWILAQPLHTSLQHLSRWYSILLMNESCHITNIFVMYRYKSFTHGKRCYSACSVHIYITNSLQQLACVAAAPLRCNNFLASDTWHISCTQVRLLQPRNVADPNRTCW